MWGTQVVPTLASFSHRGKMALANQNFILAHDTEEEILSLVSQWVGMICWDHLKVASYSTIVPLRGDPEGQQRRTVLPGKED